MADSVALVEYPVGTYGQVTFSGDTETYMVQIRGHAPQKVHVSAFATAQVGRKPVVWKCCLRYQDAKLAPCSFATFEPCSFREVREACFPKGTQLVVLHDKVPQKATVVDALNPPDVYVRVALSSGKEILVSVGLLGDQNAFEFA